MYIRLKIKKLFQRMVDNELMRRIMIPEELPHQGHPAEH
ncbi:hypothetical protein DGWBC_0414 [Dehalogenimonas sp. WBC-2]|nr:hypothetical protein DGWBC_0414 [Dehalogenimonas sp. WBC-2]